MSFWLALFVAVQGGLALRVVLRMLRTRGGVEIAASDASSPETVGLIVPVLDEEERLPACLDGAIAQPAEVVEILVVDGGSRDRTREVAERYRQKDPRVRFVDAGPAPQDWTGKIWGQSAGLRHAADVDWLLYLDADVVADSRLTRSLLAHARREAVDVLSGGVEQHLPRWDVGLVHPAFLATLVYRFGIPGSATREPSRVQGNGQCFLARRRLLEQSGALELARDSLCEDITIVRSLAAAGHAVGFYELADLARASMYQNARETWENWSRSLPMRDRYFGAREAVGLVEVVLVQALPLVGLAIGAGLGLAAGFVWLQLSLVAMRLGVHAGVARAYPDRPATYWLAPLFDLPVAAKLLQRALQRRHRWRGRRYVRIARGRYRQEDIAR